MNKLKIFRKIWNMKKIKMLYFKIKYKNLQNKTKSYKNDYQMIQNSL